MSLFLPIPALKILQRRRKITVPVRIISEPKTFVLPVAWKENLTAIPGAVQVIRPPYELLKPFRPSTAVFGKISLTGTAAF